MRSNNANVSDLFIKRWSPRAFDKNHELSDEEVTTIFAAAKWSPSCFNEQPWRFIIAKRNQPDFDKFINLLVDDNSKWAKNASLIGYIIAKKTFTKNDKPNFHSQFDSGAAWMSLSLQARELGLYTHAMAGIKNEEAIKELEIPDSHKLICGFVIGQKENKNILTADLEKIEEPNSRKDLEEILTYGSFNGKK